MWGGGIVRVPLLSVSRSAKHASKVWVVIPFFTRSSKQFLFICKMIDEYLDTVIQAQTETVGGKGHLNSDFASTPLLSLSQKRK